MKEEIHNEYYGMIIYTHFIGISWKRKIRFNSIAEVNNWFREYGLPDNYVLYKYTEEVRASS